MAFEKVSLFVCGVMHWRFEEGDEGRTPPSQSNFIHFHAVFGKYYTKKECIPVGCVPSAAVAVCWGKGRGMSTSVHAGVHTPPRPGPGAPPPVDRILDTSL